MKTARRSYNGPYQNEYLNQVAFPMGGMGAGMICLEGSGAFSHVSLRHKPEVFNEPLMFAALHVKGVPTARVLEGPVPMRKAFGTPSAGNGLSGRSYGLPRFAKALFTTRFPFGIVRLDDKTMPVKVELTGWSPFVPGDADNASLPVAGLEYRLMNRTNKTVEGVFSFHARNFMPFNDKDAGTVSPMKGGFLLGVPAVPKATESTDQFAAFTPSSGVKTDCAWFRGTWFDFLTMLWKNLVAGKSQTKAPFAKGKSSDGGSFYVPFKLNARTEQTVRVLLAWHVPQSSLCLGDDVPCDCKRGVNEPAAYVPWYATRFKDIHAVADYWRTHYDTLRARSKLFSDCFYDTTLPPEVVEAVAANLTILKSPTVLRQHDGRLWGWEGCCDTAGCCHGSCTHVWNYAQALCHLFPDLERTLRETEFFVNQDNRGHQTFRASLPIRPPAHNFHAAADGQLGGITKVHREWRISGDTAWMKNLWPKVKQSLDYCIATWDPGHTGTLVEPHHNTYDIEFWGADGMCTSFYLGALAAAIRMGRDSNADVTLYEELLAKGKMAMATTLWNGEFFFQRIRWTGLRAADPTAAQSFNTNYTPEALALLKKEGPKYQYGNGCLSDGVIGDWLAQCSGVGPVLDTAKTARHLRSVFAHNFKEDLSNHANPQRPSYAFGQEGGLLLCSWPKGGKLSLPFPYSDEVWTGIEYQVAAHLIMTGRVQEGIQVVAAARKRYDGRWRNPFNEYECGHWYARAMSSYSLLQALSGARYDAVDKTLHLQPAVKGDFKAFLSTATGFGTVGIRNGKPFLKVVSGKIDVEKIIQNQTDL
ncbi:MAG: hypothetical protein KJ964_13185 [Verrucomicrobia bacterium]|nr:hypothetical protein [Verrucomicrobiota bacterium]MBU1735566.1 hypothetical protein [Verrucomicrobiota bacterium]MBU1856549.1 hypothetical protein [Verrucomicrobiota bacterium]